LITRLQRRKRKKIKKKKSFNKKAAEDFSSAADGASATWRISREVLSRNEQSLGIPLKIIASPFSLKPHYGIKKHSLSDANGVMGSVIFSLPFSNRLYLKVRKLFL